MFTFDFDRKQIKVLQNLHQDEIDIFSENIFCYLVLFHHEIYFDPKLVNGTLSDYLPFIEQYSADDIFTQRKMTTRKYLQENTHQPQANKIQ